ncbi:hypothetical protein VNI00_010883 [Paramarasmius palmivorus]|uniref:Uncharacterized protein n=1 Tax=Paramarasmius palmivorus TaxID=297713 RepID=A0AAW0CHG6_9AGAR
MDRRDLVRPFLDLEASVDREEYGSDEEEEDNRFINDDDEEDVGMPISYNNINQELDMSLDDGNASDHDSLFSKDSRDSLFSEDEDMSRPAPAPSTTKEISSPGIARDVELEEDVERAGEVWLVRCKNGKEQYLVNYINRYIKKYPNRLFRTVRRYDDGCGFIYICTLDASRAAKVLANCPVTLRHRSGLKSRDGRDVSGFNGIQMQAIIDPVEVSMALFLRPLAQVFNDPEASWARGARVGSWVRLGEQHNKRIRLENVEEAHSKPVTPLYTNDPAIVLAVEEKTITIAFLPRVHPSFIHKSWPKGSASNNLVQTLVLDSSLYKEPSDQQPLWNRKKYPDCHFQHGLMIKTLPLRLVKPLGRYPSAMEGRLLLLCEHPQVIANFPRIDDWRFDVGDVVQSRSGEEGIVCDQSDKGPVICPIIESDDLPTIEEYSVGWALRKKWSIGDFVRHISGVSGVVILVLEYDVVIQDIRGTLAYDFQGHANSFRITQRDENAVGYSMSREPGSRLPSWVDAARLGPLDLQGEQSFFEFREEWNERLRLHRIPQQVFVLSHSEATRLLKKTRTDKIPWKGREVLVSGNCPVKGEHASVVDVHIKQPTKSGLMVTIESLVQGRLFTRHRLDYDWVVDMKWELPLHLVERPLLPIFKPPPSYIHPLTFHQRVFKLPPPPTRPKTPPLHRRRFGAYARPDPALMNEDPAFNPNFSYFEGTDEFNDPFEMQTPTPAWRDVIRHPSQLWLYEASNTTTLRFKSIVNGTIDGREFKKKKMDVYILSSDHETTAVVEYYKRGHPIPPAVEFQPVNPLVNTMEPIFIFRGPHANRIAFLPEDACVLSVKKHVTDELQHYVMAWKNAQEATLRRHRQDPQVTAIKRYRSRVSDVSIVEVEADRSLIIETVVIFVLVVPAHHTSSTRDPPSNGNVPLPTYIKRNSVREDNNEMRLEGEAGREEEERSTSLGGPLRSSEKVTGAWLTRFRGMDASCIPILVQVGLGKVLQGDEQPPDTNQDDEDATTEETVSDMDPERMALYETTYKYLVAEQPGTHERLRQCSHYGNDPVLNQIVSVMREGFRLARKADTSKLKKSIVWIIKDNPQITWDDSVVFPSLDADTKIARGLLHPSIAPLMCPASFILRFKSDDEDVREKALDDLKRAKAVTHSSLPGLLYDYRLFDPMDMYQGLFRGYMLTRAWRNLHKSPAATMNLNDASEDNGNAAIAGVKSVTPESIAYVAVQVYFALSTQTTWRRTCGKLDLYIFYRNLMKIYEAGEDSWKEDLLKFFNKEVFKDQDAADDEPEEGSDMATILAQAKARKEAAAAAAAAAAAQSTTQGGTQQGSEGTQQAGEGAQAGEGTQQGQGQGHEDDKDDDDDEDDEDDGE